MSKSQCKVETIGHLVEKEDANVTAKIAEEFKSGFVIVDHYELSSVWEDIVNEKCHVIAFDDIPSRSHSVSALIDGTPGRLSESYSALTERHCKHLVSNRYLITRKAFYSERQESLLNKLVDPKMKTISIAFGGTDTLGLSQVVVDFLRAKGFNGRIIVITSSLNIKLISLKRVCSEHDAELHIDSREIAKLMSQSDLMIGALGTNSWERAVLGVPSIAMQAVDNQKDIFNYLKNILGCIVVNTSDALKSAISDYLFSFNNTQYKEQVMSLASLCDGLGAYRIVLELFKQDIEIELSDFKLEDCDQLYLWQSETGARRFSRNTSIPSYEEHSNWVANNMKSPDVGMWIVQLNNLPCGYVRLDKCKECEEISILISESFAGYGIATKAIGLLKRKSRYGRLLAEVDPQNVPSVKAFAKNGFKSLSERQYEWREYEIH